METVELTEIMKSYGITADKDDFMRAFKKVAHDGSKIRDCVAWFEDLEEHGSAAEAFVAHADKLVESSMHCQSYELWQMTRHIHDMHIENINKKFSEEERLQVAINLMLDKWTTASKLMQVTGNGVFMSAATIFHIPLVTHYVLERVRH